MAIANLITRGGVSTAAAAAIKYFPTHGIDIGNPVPPPVNTAIIVGLSMVQSGLTILSGLTTQLIKGLVKDELNNITR